MSIKYCHPGASERSCSRECGMWGKAPMGSCSVTILDPNPMPLVDRLTFQLCLWLPDPCLLYWSHSFWRNRVHVHRHAPGNQWVELTCDSGLTVMIPWFLPGSPDSQVEAIMASVLVLGGGLGRTQVLSESRDSEQLFINMIIYYTRLYVSNSLKPRPSSHHPSSLWIINNRQSFLSEFLDQGPQPYSATPAQIFHFQSHIGIFKGPEFWHNFLALAFMLKQRMAKLFIQMPTFPAICLGTTLLLAVCKHYANLHEIKSHLQNN